MKARITAIFLLFLAGFMLTQSLQAQVVTTAPDLTACPGAQISAPIVVDNFTDVASASLILNYDPAVITYTGYTNNPAMAGGFIVVNSPAPYSQTRATWFALAPLSLANGSVLFTFNYNYLQGSTTLEWSTFPGDNMYSDLMGIELPATWVNGSVSPSAPAPSFAIQPVNVSINEGGDASFVVEVNDAISLQWQVSSNGGGTWTDVTDGGVYSGATTAGLSITGATLSMNGYLFRLIATGDCNQSTTSDEVMLTVTTVSTDILAQIASLPACPGSQLLLPISVTNFDNVGSFSLEIDVDPAVLTFNGLMNVNPALASATVVAVNQGNFITIDWTGTAPASIGTGILFDLDLTYISGNTNLTWYVDACYFYAPGMTPLTANYFDGAVSQAAPLLTINTQPVSQSINAMSSASFSVDATGATSYLWQVSTDAGGSWNNLANGGVYSGVTTASLMMNNVPLAYNGNLYRCICSESVCEQTQVSDAASLTVILVTTDIVTTLGSVVTCPAADSSVMVSIPVNVINFNNVASASIKVNYDTLALVYDTTVNFHPVFASGFLAINATGGQVGFAWMALTPASFGTGTLFDLQFYYLANNSPLTFDLTPGSCMYTDIDFNVLPAQWIDGMVTLQGPEITSMPTDQTVFSGNDATFTLTGNNITSYQWQGHIGGVWTDLTDGAEYSGTTTGTLTAHAVTLAMDGSHYRCVVDGVCGPQTSHEVMLMVINSTPVTVTLPTTAQCAGPIVVPVTVTDFNDVGSFNLKLTTVGNVLIYNGFQNVNPAVAGMTLTNTANSVTLNFTSATPVAIGTGTLVELKFNTSAGSTPLTWDPTPGVNFIKSVNNTILPSVLTNGAITINPLPGPPGAIQGPSAVCQNVTSTAYSTTGATNATTYAWELIPVTAGTIAGTGLSITVNWDPAFTGTAFLTVKGQNSCGYGPVINKTVTRIPLPNVTLAPFSNICTNDTLLLTGGNPVGGTYSGTGVVDSMFYPSVSGVGTFVITYTYSQQGCTASATSNITVNQSPTVTFTLPANLDTVSPNYPAFQLTGGSPAGGTYSGPGVVPATGFFNPAASGNGTWVITYTYVTPEGCQGQAFDTLLVDPTVGIYNDQLIQVAVQPNPSKGIFRINILSRYESIDMGIFNDLGQQVYTEKLNALNGLISKDIDLSNQPRGLYFLKLMSREGVKIEKIVLN